MKILKNLILKRYSYSVGPAGLCLNNLLNLFNFFARFPLFAKKRFFSLRNWRQILIGSTSWRLGYADPNARSDRRYGRWALIRAVLELGHLTNTLLIVAALFLLYWYTRPHNFLSTSFCMFFAGTPSIFNPIQSLLVNVSRCLYAWLSCCISDRWLRFSILIHNEISFGST